MLGRIAVLQLEYWLRNNKKKTFWVTVFVLLVAYFFWPYSLRIHGTMPKNEKFKFLIQFSTDTPIPLLCQDYSFGNNIWLSRSLNTTIEVQADPVSGAFDISVPLRKPGIFCRWDTDESILISLVNKENTVIGIVTPKKNVEPRPHTIECKKIEIEELMMGEVVYCRADGITPSPELSNGKELAPITNKAYVYFSPGHREIEVDFLFDDSTLHSEEFPTVDEVWGDK